MRKITICATLAVFIALTASACNMDAGAASDPAPLDDGEELQISEPAQINDTILTEAQKPEILTYRNSKYGYSFNYPSFWEPAETGKWESAYFFRGGLPADALNFGQAGEGEHVTVIETEDTISSLAITVGHPAADLDDVTDEFIEKSYSPSFEGFSVVSSEMTVVGGVSAKRFEADVMADDVSLKMLMYVFNINEHVLTFAGMCSEDNAETDIGELENMVASMSFDNTSMVGAKIVGEENYGYLEIPADWVNFMDIGTVQMGRKSVAFASLDGLIITLDYYGASDVKPYDLAMLSVQRQERNGATGVDIQQTKIDGIDAYLVSAYYGYDDTMLFGWYFYDGSNELHYISAEGPVDRVSDAVEIVVNSFSLEQ